MKKKILFINGHLNTGGVEKALTDILRNWDYDRYDVDLLLLEDLGDYAPQLPEQVNIILKPLQNTYGSFPGCITRCIRKQDWFSLRMRLHMLMASRLGGRMLKPAGRLLLGRHHYDCVIGFRPGFSTEFAAFAIKADRRIAWWHHGEVVPSQRSFPASAQFCDAVAVVSDSCREMVSREFPELADKLVTVHNMLDVSAVQQKAAAFDPYPEKDTLHIVSVGRLSPEKHFDNAIFAAKQLKRRGIGFKWHLVGDGMLWDALRQKAAELDVADCFIFEGNQVNPYPYIKHADLFVHPSYVESFGIVVTEALALGVPCVVTKSTGVMDFLTDGKNAVFTDPNPESLSEKVFETLRNDVLRKQLRETACCPEVFSPDKVMKKIYVLLEPDK